MWFWIVVIVLVILWFKCKDYVVPPFVGKWKGDKMDIDVNRFGGHYVVRGHDGDKNKFMFFANTESTIDNTHTYTGHMINSTRNVDLDIVKVDDTHLIIAGIPVTKSA
jgi:hypothetical protein